MTNRRTEPFAKVTQTDLPFVHTTFQLEDRREYTQEVLERTKNIETGEARPKKSPPLTMGNEESRPFDPDAPPETLRSRTLEDLAAHIIGDDPAVHDDDLARPRHPGARRIVVLTGAGISTSAGIPDFRSPGTGLYANLARLNLPNPQAVFDLSYFRENPTPFYTLAHELYPSDPAAAPMSSVTGQRSADAKDLPRRFEPTIAHAFIRLLQDKQLLSKCFTQNIDTLERAAGVDPALLIEAHGSFAGQHCIDCGAAYPDHAMRDHIAARTIPRCVAPACGGLVKPDIVFFGERLPDAFWPAAQRDVPRADVLIVMGTSLAVAPFSGLPGLVRRGTPRVLVNREQVGDLGHMSDDVLLLGECDAGVRRLARACGWEEELERVWESVAPIAAARWREQQQQAASQDVSSDTVEGDMSVQESQDAALRDEVARLTQEVDETLSLSKAHSEAVLRGEGEKNQEQNGFGDRDAGSLKSQTGTTARSADEGNDTGVSKTDSDPAEANGLDMDTATKSTVLRDDDEGSKL